MQPNVSEIGKPNYFDIGIHKAAIIQMIQSDELIIALRMIKDLPAYYRKNPPPELTEIKKRLYKQTYDQIEYSTDEDEFQFACDPEAGAAQWTSDYCFPRAGLITNAIRDLNDAGEVPWILDVGCSHGNMPLGLKKLGIKFNYLGLAPNFRASAKLKEHVGDDIWKNSPMPNQKTILVCTEVIEHCMNPQDIVHSAYKYGADFDQIFLSVPLGCLYGGLPDWDTRRMGHVRGWTDYEFREFASDSFPGYNWTQFLSHSQVLHGIK